MKTKNIGASVRARLLNHARENKLDFQKVLIRYALERILYRISISNYVDNFLLKGALLFDLWFDIPHRSTMDADFLGFGRSELPYLETIFKEICAIEVLDGMVFHSETMRVSEIRKESNYSGVRVELFGTLDNARCPIQIDIGFGDVVTPNPEEALYPVILSEFEAPKLRVYPHYTVVAEKFEALTILGIANSRMKDYFDLWVLAMHTDFEGKILQEAIQATFNCRKTQLTDRAPFGLTDDFAQDTKKQIQWQAFLKRNQLEALNLEKVVKDLRIFLMPIIQAIHNKKLFTEYWKKAGEWSDKT